MMICVKIKWQNMFWRLASVISCVLLLSACGSKMPESKAVAALAPDFFGVGEELAAQLFSNSRYSVSRDQALIFSTIVNLDDLSQTSQFGRILSESMATSMFRRGYGVIELRKTAGVLLKDNAGELVLSRDATKLAKEHRADAILAGTYSLTPSSVIINIKLLDAGSQEVLSVAGMELQRTHTVNFLLASGGTGAVDSQLSVHEM